MKKYVLLFLLFAALRAFSQTAEEEAQILFVKAQQAYEEKDYKQSLNLLEKCIEKLGKSNGKIQYLKIKSNYDGIANGILDAGFNRITKLLDDVSEYFKIIDKSKTDPEKYKEIIDIKLMLEDKKNIYLERKKAYDAFKKRESKFLSDTINYFIAAFVAEYNQCPDNYEKSKKQKKRLVEYSYDSIRYRLVVTNHSFNPESVVLLKQNIDYLNSADSQFRLSKSEMDSIISFSSASKIEIDILKPIKFGEYLEYSNTLPRNYFTFLDKEICCLDYSNEWIIRFKKSIELQKTGIVYNIDEKYTKYNCKSYIGKIVELKKIMDSSGFTDFYGGKYDDVKDIRL